MFGGDAGSMTWTSPNGATSVTSTSGVTITAFNTYNHPVIVPTPQIDAGVDDYTVTATIVSPPTNPTPREFGILARVQSDGSAVIFGSEYGGTTTPFVGTIPAGTWSPPAIFNAQKAPLLAQAPNTRYTMKLRVAGTTVSAKMWDATDPEPASWQVTWTGPYATGRGTGFYTYVVNGARLENITVTPQ